MMAVTTAFMGRGLQASFQHGAALSSSIFSLGDLQTFQFSAIVNLSLGCVISIWCVDMRKVYTSQLYKVVPSRTGTCLSCPVQRSCEKRFK